MPSNQAGGWEEGTGAAEGGSGGQGGERVDWKRVSWVTINQQDKKATGAFD